MTFAMTPPQIKALVIAIYGLCFPVAFLIGDAFGKVDRFGNKSQTVLPMLIGLVCLAPFVLLFGWTKRVAPSASRVLLAAHAGVLVLLLIPGAVNFALLWPFPLLLATLYFSQREARRGYMAWLRAKAFVPVPDPSGAVLDKLDRRHQWLCHANSLSLANGRTIPFFLWEGIGTTTTMPAAGSSLRMRTKFGLIAFSLSSRDAGNAFIHKIEALSQSELTFWQRLKPSNQERHPYLAELLPDGTFVAGWMTPHVAGLVEDRLQMLREILEESEPTFARKHDV
jgi:hypothetical protein